MKTALLLLALPQVTAFSSGGGSGTDNNGVPFVQACDALTVCAPVICPPGMTAVAPPERSEVYRFGTADGATSYVPGELVIMNLELTKRTIVGKRDAGLTLVANETAKYLGLLLYAVDANENKVGTWKVAVDEAPKFWTPPDPGCGGKALMHADAELKGYEERFVFEPPPAGTGPITFRVLVKQGETNKGAFYWASSVNTSSDVDVALQVPSRGEANGDLVLREGTPPGATSSGTIQWIRAPYRAVDWPGAQTCTQVCSTAGMTCDNAALRAASSEAALLPQIERDILCAPPLLAGCLGAPRMSGLGDGWCWFRDPACTETMPPCDELPPNDYETSIRLCACTGGSGRRVRRLDDVAPKTVDQQAMAKEAAKEAERLRKAASARSPADCPVMRAKAIAARGGLVSSTADAAYDAIDLAHAKAASATSEDEDGAKPLWKSTGSYEVVLDGVGPRQLALDPDARVQVEDGGPPPPSPQTPSCWDTVDTATYLINTTTIPQRWTNHYVNCAWFSSASAPAGACQSYRWPHGEPSQICCVCGGGVLTAPPPSPDAPTAIAGRSTAIAGR